MTSSRGESVGRVLAWLHIGGLHLAEAGLENHRDLGRIVALANALPPGSLDFALLPGDTPILSIEAQADNGRWMPMMPVPSEAALWQARCEAPGGVVRVRARDANERTDQDTVEPARPGWTAPEGAGNGSDRDQVGARPERGIPDTQLGPNRSGKNR